MLGYLECVFTACPLIGQWRYDLRNYFAGPLDQHPVLDEETLALDVFEVVQGRLLHHRAADLDRLEHRVWVQGTGAADVDSNVEQTCRRQVGRKLVANRPARVSLSDHTEIFPQAH